MSITAISSVTNMRPLTHHRVTHDWSCVSQVTTVALFITRTCGWTQRPVVVDRYFVKHNLHWTLPLNLIVYSKLHVGVQSAKMLPSFEKGGDGVLFCHTFGIKEFEEMETLFSGVIFSTTMVPLHRRIFLVVHQLTGFLLGRKFIAEIPDFNESWLRSWSDLDLLSEKLLVIDMLCLHLHCGLKKRANFGGL